MVASFSDSRLNRTCTVLIQLLEIRLSAWGGGDGDVLGPVSERTQGRRGGRAATRRPNLRPTWTRRPGSHSRFACAQAVAWAQQLGQWQGACGLPRALPPGARGACQQADKPNPPKRGIRAPHPLTHAHERALSVPPRATIPRVGWDRGGSCEPIHADRGGR